MFIFRKKFIFLTIVTAFFILSGCDDEKKEQKSVDLILDYTPNTNHTGLFVALENGYFGDINVNIKKAPEDSTSDLIITGKAPFGIYFQESMGAKLAKGAPITAVAAIISHNTGGILSKDKLNSPKDLQNLRYGSWQDPVEQGMIKHLISKYGGDVNALKIVPNTGILAKDSFANDLFDACFAFYGWDGIASKSEFIYLKDYEKAFDYYSPIIIANNDFLKNNEELAKKVIMGIKKGYIYAMQNPRKSAEILIKYAPELESKRDFIIKSQKYLSKHYADDANRWGEFDEKRWNGFYEWLNNSNILPNKIPLGVGFTNKYLR